MSNSKVVNKKAAEYDASNVLHLGKNLSLCY